MVVMYKPSVIDSPTGGAPKKDPRWDLTGTKGCGGGIRVLVPYLIVLGYVGIYRRKKYVGGATWPHEGGGAPFYLMAASLLPSFHSKSPGLRLFQK